MAGTEADAELVTEEGQIYGVVPKGPEEPEDLEIMFEAVGIPTSTGPDAELPFSLEWYAGAKERQRLRDIELEGLLVKRNEVRLEWADIVFADLQEWGGRADKIASEPPATSGLAELLARTAHQRPGDFERIELLARTLEEADETQMTLTDQLRDAHAKLVVTEDAIQHKVNEENLAEKDRIEQKRLAAERKKKAEKALRKNEALLRGEDPDLLDLDEESRAASPQPGPKVKAKEPATSPGQKPAVLIDEVTGSSLQPAGRLPPLQDPPKPPAV